MQIRQFTYTLSKSGIEIHLASTKPHQLSDNAKDCAIRFYAQICECLLRESHIRQSMTTECTGNPHKLEKLKGSLLLGELLIV